MAKFGSLREAGVLREGGRLPRAPGPPAAGAGAELWNNRQAARRASSSGTGRPSSQRSPRSTPGSRWGKPDEEVFGGDVGVVQVAGGVFGKVEGLAEVAGGAGGGSAGYMGVAGEFGVDGGGNPLGRDFELLEHRGDDAVLLFQQALRRWVPSISGVSADAGGLRGGRDGFGGPYGDTVGVHVGFSVWRML